MTTDQGVAFLTALRVKQIHVKGNGWIEGSCPFARWLHQNRRDTRPSFGLTIAPGERSRFLCFACRQGSAEELVGALELYTKGSPDYDFATCRALLADEQQVMPLPPYGEFPQPTQVFVEWPTWWTENFIRAEFVQDAAVYLASRGVPLSVVGQFDLRYDPKRQMVIAPYVDVFNRLAGARGRSILADAPQKHYDYTYQGINNARLVWYHEEVLNLPGPVVVVEGQFDVMRVAQVFPKVVGALTSKPNQEKMKKLGDCGTVVQIPDRDEAGKQSITAYARHCDRLGLNHTVIWLDEGVKDPADCHPEYLRDRIQAALNCT